MTKADLINAMAEKGSEGSKLTKAHCKEMVDLMQSCMIDALSKGEEVSLVGFGTFKILVRDAHVGRNPKTGANIDIPSSNFVSFRSARALKESVNK